MDPWYDTELVDKTVDYRINKREKWLYKWMDSKENNNYKTGNE